MVVLGSLCCGRRDGGHCAAGVLDDSVRLRGDCCCYDVG